MRALFLKSGIGADLILCLPQESEYNVNKSDSKRGTNMTNEILFWTQIGALVTYIVSVFYLYQLLVKQKDATIDSKNSTIELLREEAN